MHMKTLLLGLICLMGTACNPANGEKKMDVSKIDWKALEFTCVHQKDIWPQVDNEADEWFQKARKLQKAGNERNDEEIAALYHKAAERNHFKAINNLIPMYLRGEGVEPSEAKAVELAERLMNMNIGGGYYHMGVFLEQGIGVKQDRPASLAYFRKAADLGNDQGQEVVGDKMMLNFYLTPMKDKMVEIGRQMLECSLGQGHAPAGHKLGMFYASEASKEDHEKALRYFQQAGKLGYPDSLFYLYDLFENGELGFAKDPARAACYYKLRQEVREDKSKRYPNLDDLCPLPPAPMPGGR